MTRGCGWERAATASRLSGSCCCCRCCCRWRVARACACARAGGSWQRMRKGVWKSRRVRPWAERWELVGGAPSSATCLGSAGRSGRVGCGRALQGARVGIAAPPGFFSPSLATVAASRAMKPASGKDSPLHPPSFQAWVSRFYLDSGGPFLGDWVVESPGVLPGSGCR